MNDNQSNKILEALYKRGKASSKGNVFDARLYDADEILSDAGVPKEVARPFLEILLKEKGYIEWDDISIRLTLTGLEYCLETFERPKFGFIK